MKKFVVIILLLTLPFVLLNGCAKKQDVEKKVETEEIEKEAPVDTIAPPPADEEAVEEATEEAPQEEAK